MSTLCEGSSYNKLWCFMVSTIKHAHVTMCVYDEIFSCPSINERMFQQVGVKKHVRWYLRGMAAVIQQDTDVWVSSPPPLPTTQPLFQNIYTRCNKTILSSIASSWRKLIHPPSKSVRQHEALEWYGGCFLPWFYVTTLSMYYMSSLHHSRKNTHKLKFSPLDG